MKNLIKVIILIFILMGCSLNKIYANELIRIGVVVPLSGEYKDIGESILKSIRLALNKIDDSKIIVIPKDTKNNPETTLQVSKELYNQGIKIILGPVFNKNILYLNQLKDVTFISFTNKLINNPKNVISSGVNAISQLHAIIKLQKELDLKRSVFLIPDNENKKEIEKAISKTKIKLKDIFYYNTDPTKLTAQIEKLTRYEQRKQNLIDEIFRLESSNEINKDKKIENLKKRDTIGGINFDSVIIADFDESLKSVATSLLYTDVSSNRISYICFNQWFDESLLNEKSLQPIYFPSINKENLDSFNSEYFKNYNNFPNQISFLSYDLVGLIYYLIYKNDFIIDEKVFYNENKFKGKTGVFEIQNNEIKHHLNVYVINDEKFKKIF